MQDQRIDANAATARPAVDRWQYLLWPALLMLLASNAFRLLHQPLQVDIAWYLYVGQQLLGGKRLYVDILENNPPLICFLNELPNWIAAVLHLNVKPIWLAFASVLVATPAVLCIYFIDRLGVVAGWRRALTGFVLGVLCVVPFAPIFGERDHFAFAASLGLMGLAANRIAEVKIPLAVAVFASAWAGLLVALKPFFLVPWMLCMLFTFWQVRGRVWRYPETYIIPAFTVLHGLLIVLVTPAYFDVVRLAWRLYGGYDIPRRQIVAAMVLPLWGLALSLFYRPTPQFRPLIRLTSVVTAGWILSAILQRKGNDYHLMPSLAAVALLGYFVLLDLWGREVWPRICRAPVSVAGLLVFVVAAGYTGIEERNLKIDYFNGSGVLLPVLRNNRHERVLFLSTSLIAFPAVNETEVEFGSAYPCLWTLPGLYAAATHSMEGDGELPFHDLATMPAAEHDLFDRTYSELAQKPKLIIVDAHRYKWAMRSAIFDFETYFQRDERISKLWQRYHELPAVRDFRIYRLR